MNLFLMQNFFTICYLETKENMEETKEKKHMQEEKNLKEIDSILRETFEQKYCYFDTKNSEKGFLFGFNYFLNIIAFLCCFFVLFKTISDEASEDSEKDSLIVVVIFGLIFNIGFIIFSEYIKTMFDIAKKVSDSSDEKTLKILDKESAQRLLEIKNTLFNYEFFDFTMLCLIIFLVVHVAMSVIMFSKITNKILLFHIIPELLMLVLFIVNKPKLERKLLQTVHMSQLSIDLSERKAIENINYFPQNKAKEKEDTPDEALRKQFKKVLEDMFIKIRSSYIMVYKSHEAYDKSDKTNQ